MSKSRSTGTTAETAVVRYLQNWWPAAERRALSGNKDKGDVAGIPGVCIEIKAAKTLELAAWRRETWTEMENAGAHTCVLVVKRPYKPVSKWDAYMPMTQLDIGSEYLPPGGIYEWVRSDLLYAAVTLRTLGY